LRAIGNKRNWGNQIGGIMDARIEADRVELETLRRAHLTVVK
jgi:hypothetical protein